MIRLPKDPETEHPLSQSLESSQSQLLPVVPWLVSSQPVVSVQAVASVHPSESVHPVLSEQPDESPQPDESSQPVTPPALR